MKLFSPSPPLGPPLGQDTAANSIPVVLASDQTSIGSLTETAPASDTASSGLNGRLQRVAQRLTSLIALVPTSLGTKTAANSFSVTPASDATFTLPTGAATSANQSSQTTLFGAVTETAPASDTASSGLNGRLQRIAQRLTSMIALLPSSLGIKTAAGSFSIAPASDAVFTTANGVPAALTVKQAAITVGTSAVRLTTDGSAPSSTRRYIYAVPDDAATGSFYIGSSSVTSTGATRGIKIAPFQPFARENDCCDLYIISDTAAQTIFLLEEE